jgi:hypothetical protein
MTAIPQTKQFGRIVETQSGCWEWQGANNQGYGVVGFTKRIHRVTRIVYRIFHGRIKASAVVCHTCDNPRCCNPRHLFAGSHSDNMQDAVSKGRRTGPSRRLTIAKVAAIRAEYAIGNISHAELANKYSAHINTIGALLRGETWTGKLGGPVKQYPTPAK